ncbi:sigma-54-dependent Fis family transcriptional regulator [Clostridium taeniosporum]|uniref:Sigma-54-dependent Fis family transcriptional regulator n=1 Tax=Clostridium taeniosporum TaxID=394958 RepID=A0A1D7XJS9_9CLOT|nr:sigma 54-interacting transcriptional regulator [Clostridium taeniosporum]AOR23604.1 sigma-54-dependent Fis family transcriptional regulator [Clostridium taeniosporum]
MLEENTYQEILNRSYERCIKYGVEKNIHYPSRILKKKELNILMRKNFQLINIAKPFMEILYDFLRGSGFSLYLTDEDGVVLTIIGDEDIIRDQIKVGIIEGTDMSEKSAGTNGIGTALYEDCSVQILGEEHFIKIFHIWTCSSAVIHNEGKDIIGCLNLTGRRQLAHAHTLGLVVAAVKSIENHLKFERTQKELFKAHQYLNRVMNSLNLGIFAVDIEGIVKAINNSACDMLNIKENDVINKNVNSVLSNWEEIFDHLKNGRTYEDIEIVYSNKKKRFNLNVYPIKDKEKNINGMVCIFKDIKNVYNLVNKYTGRTAQYTFTDIIGKSEQIIKLKKQAQSISNSPSTVLIQGESGTGKELIAQSIHNNSDRRNYSFVAINCGAIPKSLIESELFGYEEGAFTGAKRGGCAGKFELANKGTLFLDEIGEMPLDMQINLLRVLQEGCITRIGGNKCINVNVRIIAATNKNLKNEVEKGTFREDLYYRLSVIPIYVPPLRERTGDIEILIEHFLKIKSLKLGKSIPNLNKNLYKKLLNYDWPGNIRELENCIENIVNMDGDTYFSFENKKTVKEKKNHSNIELQYNMCSLKELEEKAINICLNNYNGNISKSCKVLGINRSTLYAKIKKYNIKFR